MQICLIEVHQKEPDTRFISSVMVKRSSSAEQNQDNSLTRHSTQKKIVRKGHVAKFFNVSFEALTDEVPLGLTENACKFGQWRRCKSHLPVPAFLNAGLKLK